MTEVMGRWGAERDHTRGASAPEADEDTPEAVLALARSLADRLARLHVHEHKADAVRLARAMALNVVDLLEAPHR